MNPWTLIPLGSLLIGIGVGAAVLSPAPAFADPATAGAQRVAFRNELPSEYQLERVRLIVDGAQAVDTAQAFDLSLAPNAPHVVTVIADYRLRDSVFTYVNGIHVQVRSTHEIAPMAGHETTVVAVAAPRGGVTTPVQKRAAIGWEQRIR